jgi:hypothetical protein
MDICGARTGFPLDGWPAEPQARLFRRQCQD